MSGSTEFTCRELVEALTDYLEDAMPADDRARLEAHLAGLRRLHERPAPVPRHDPCRAATSPRNRSPNPRGKSIRQVFRRWRSDQEPEQAR